MLVAVLKDRTHTFCRSSLVRNLSSLLCYSIIYHLFIWIGASLEQVATQYQTLASQYHINNAVKVRFALIAGVLCISLPYMLWQLLEEVDCVIYLTGRIMDRPDRFCGYNRNYCGIILRLV